MPLLASDLSLSTLIFGYLGSASILVAGFIWALILVARRERELRGDYD